MITKVFSLRIDVESDKGIRNGIPKILDLLKKYNIKASFYLTMGGATGLICLIRYRKPMVGERKIKIYTFSEKLKGALIPKDFVTDNKDILMRIVNEGHELGIHGWKHRAWTRAIDKIDIKKHLQRAKRKYEKIFGKKAETFASPGFITNEKIISLLNEEGFKVISDLPGKEPFKIQGTQITNVPITINGENNSPIIESLVSAGFSDDEIFEKIIEIIKKEKLATMYIHDMFECVQKIELLERIFKFLNQNNIQIKTIEEIAK